MNSERVYAIITMYRPKIKDFIHNIKIISSQVDKIIILDNSETEEYFCLIKKQKIFHSVKNIQYIKMKNNLGLGAINIGIDLAKREQANYVLLLDQDSTPKNNIVSLMLDAYRQNKNLPIAAIGPTLVNKRTGEKFRSRLKKGKKIDNCLLEVEQLPTSGMLIPIKIFDDVGRFCEKLFLDIVDFEWCWRATKKGYKILRHEEAIMEHELGEDTKKLWFIEYNVPSPKRQYYLFRNSVFVITCNYAPKYVRFRYLIFTIIKFFLYNLFLPNKVERLKYTIKGLKDGVKTWIFGSNVCIPQR